MQDDRVKSIYESIKINDFELFCKGFHTLSCKIKIIIRDSVELFNEEYKKTFFVFESKYYSDYRYKTITSKIIEFATNDYKVSYINEMHYYVWGREYEKFHHYVNNKGNPCGVKLTKNPNPKHRVRGRAVYLILYRPNKPPINLCVFGNKVFERK